MSVLRSAPKPVGSRIAGVGHYQPELVVTNADLVARGVDTDDDWIRTRVGITERRFAVDESLLDMAEAAASKAIANCSIGAGEIDLVILTTSTALIPLPGGAAELATRLGIAAPGAYDVNAACAGFVYALTCASNAVLAGQARNVLVVAAEKFTDWLDFTDRSTCIIFADGAGAVIVTGSDDTEIGPVVWGSDGAQSDAIRMKIDTHAIAQDGQTVYRWATSTIGDVCRRACDSAGVAVAELAGFIPHQANLRIIELIAKKLGIAPDSKTVIARDVVVSGNTSAASIPLALSKMLQRGEVGSGEPVLLVGFGAGLTYAAQVVLAP